MNETSQRPSCSRCGAPLSSDALNGLCPRCLMALNLAAPTEIPGETGPHGTKVVKPPPTPDEIAKHFPQFEILECLGRGGMGVVYRTRQPKLNRIVALKILAPEKVAEPKFAERFEREAQALARLNHPNIVTVYDFGEADGLYYLTMEFVDGVSLRRLLQTRKIAPEEALAIVPKICEALQFAHEQGVVHRDIKPENVLLDKRGRVKIADFGIAKIVGEAGGAGSPLPAGATQAEGGEPGVTRPTTAPTQDQILGTPNYMAPEQVEHPQTVDHRADIYSLGVVFYEMLTGELPLGKFQPPSKKVQIDVRLDEVVLHALEKEPDRRYQHASQVRTDVETIAAGPATPAAAGKPTAPVFIKRWCDLWPWDMGYLALFLSVPPLAAGVLVLILMPQWGLKALWLFAFELIGIGLAATYAWVGHRIQRLKAALPRPTGEVAEGLVFWRPFQSPGLAVLHADRLELIPIKGSPITVALEDIVAVSEVRWFNGTRLWWKRGFVLELADGRRVGVAVAEPFARRWRARLSRGRLPELPAKSEIRNPKCESVASGPPRFSRTAIVGALWIGLFFLNWVVSYTPPGWALTRLFRNSVLHQIAELLLFLPLTVLGFAALAGGTALGVVALRQIRQSRGAIRGFGLTVFDVLFFPQLLMNGWAIWLAWLVGSQIRSAGSAAVAVSEPPWSAVAALILVGLALNGFLIRAVVRMAKQFVNTPAPPVHPPVAGTWPEAFKGAWVRLLLVIVAELALIETLAQMSVHWKESTGELWSMALAVVSLAGLVWAFWPGYRVKRSWFFWAGGTIVSAFLLLALDNFYSWHLRPNLGLYQEPDWVSQHPGFQKQLRERIERNLWRHPESKSTGPTDSHSFGPVIERVVTNMIDFDSGALVDLPLPTQPGERDQERYDWINGEGVPWMRAQGIDAIDGNHAMIGVDLWLFPLERREWQSLTPAALQKKLRSLGLPTAQSTDHLEDNRGTYGFETREGSLGILQITDANLPRGVKIRYKLAQFSSAGDSRTFTRQQAENDILRVKLRHAEEDAALAEAKFKVGMIPRSDLQAAKDNVALLQAETAGDANQVAQVRLTAAENQLAAAKALFDIGLIPNSEYEAAQNAVELRQAELRAVRAARSVVPSAIPVIERQLRTAGDAAEDRVLDLDDGRLLSVPTNVVVASVNNPRPLLNWMVEHGADLLVTDDPSSTNLNFHLDDGRLLRSADNSTCDGITVSASDVGRQLAQREASQDADVPKVDVGAQPVFLFKTREGGVGVLQILDLTDNPRGVKIRYRIVHVASAKNLQWPN